MPTQLETLSVAAVIAVYNGREHIISAIESILNQTVPVEQIVIVDDGSTDGSVELIQTYVDSNPFAQRLVKIVRQPNGGQGFARNTGVYNSTSELIGFLDQDDTWEPNHVREMAHHFAADPSLGWVYTDFNEIDENNRFIRRQFLAKQSYRKPINSIFGLISRDLMMLPSASLIRKEAFQAIGGFDTQFRGYEDDDLFIRLFVNGWDFKYLPESLVNYRIHPNNSSRNLTFPKSRIKFYKKYRDFFDDESEYFAIYFRQHLAPRMISAAIQDAAIAARDDDEPARRLASDFLHEIFCDTGFNIRSRIVYFSSRNSRLLKFALSARHTFKKKQKYKKIY